MNDVAKPPLPARPASLREILEAAKAETGRSLQDLSVLSNSNDPYRFDTPGTHVNAPEGHCSTWALIRSVSARESSIQGRRAGSKTWGRPRAQIPVCQQRPDFHTTVISSLL